MSILGGFYIYRAEAKDADPDITGVVIFKDIGSNDQHLIIFGYFPIPPNIMRLGTSKGQPSMADLASFNPIHDFLIPDKKTYNISIDKGIHYYHPETFEEFIRKCYTPPL